MSDAVVSQSTLLCVLLVTLTLFLVSCLSLSYSTSMALALVTLVADDRTLTNRVLPSYPSVVWKGLTRRGAIKGRRDICSVMCRIVRSETGSVTMGRVLAVVEGMMVGDQWVAMSSRAARAARLESRGAAGRSGIQRLPEAAQVPWGKVIIRVVAIILSRIWEPCFLII